MRSDLRPTQSILGTSWCANILARIPSVRSGTARAEREVDETRPTWMNGHARSRRFSAMHPVGVESAQSATMCAAASVAVRRTQPMSTDCSMPTRSRQSMARTLILIDLSLRHGTPWRPVVAYPPTARTALSTIMTSVRRFAFARGGWKLRRGRGRGRVSQDDRCASSGNACIGGIRRMGRQSTLLSTSRHPQVVAAQATVRINEEGRTGRTGA